MAAVTNNQYNMSRNVHNSLPAMANFSRRVERMEDRNNHPMYLLDKDSSSNLYRFHMSGTHQDIYTTEINRLTGEVNCSCPDGVRYRDAQGTICKHLCFVLFKVLKVLSYLSHDRRNVYTFHQDTVDFINKNKLVLTRSQLATCDVNFSGIDFSNTTLIKADLRTVFENIKQKGKGANKVDDGDELKDFVMKKEVGEDDECPICYADIEIGGDEELMSCPSCSNALHKKCMEEWVQRGKDKCIYCGGSWTKLTTVVKRRANKEDIVFKNLENLDFERLQNKDLMKTGTTLIQSATEATSETTQSQDSAEAIEMTTVVPEMEPEETTPDVVEQSNNEVEQVIEDERAVVDDDEVVEDEVVEEEEPEQEVVDEDQEYIVDEDSLDTNEVANEATSEVNDNSEKTQENDTSRTFGEKIRTYFKDKIARLIHHLSNEPEIEEVD